MKDLFNVRSRLLALFAYLAFAVLAYAGLATVRSSSPAVSLERNALVIGVGDYKGCPKLLNAVNDARAAGKAIEEAGFKVTLVLDPTSAALKQACAEFLKRSKSGVRLVYFAGHGVEVDGKLYCVPADAIKVESPADLQAQAILLRELLPSSNDAETDGEALLFSTDTGKDGYDNDKTDGANSPFTSAFVAALKQKDQSLTQIVARLSNLMLTSTDGQRRPELRLTTHVDFILNPAKPTPSASFSIGVFDTARSNPFPNKR